jgi:hypothetical protein
MNKFSSTFGQVLQIFSKKEFSLAVRETQSERGAKGVFLMEPVRGHAFLSEESVCSSAGRKGMQTIRLSKKGLFQLTGLS